MHADKKLHISRALDATAHQVDQFDKSAQRDNCPDGHKCYKELNPNVKGRRGVLHVPMIHPGRRKEYHDSVKENTDTRIEGLREGKEKEVDVVVLDASVLIHCLNRVKDWCKKGRQEVLVVPLEALNTLDFLKKGSSSLAQKARAASRLLEAQVGSNPRIRVQRDDAFVPWDDITFRMSEVNNGTDSAGTRPLSPPPEWLRRTICCAQWEVRNASSEASLANTASHIADTLSSRPVTPTSDESNEIRFTSSAKVHEQVEAGQRLPQVRYENVKVALAVMDSGPSDPALASIGRYDRADGALTRIWSQRAGIDLILIEPTPLITPPRNQGHDKRDYRDGRKDKDRRPSLVEKPISIAIVNDQPPKSLRLLARGEKLDP